VTDKKSREKDARTLLKYSFISENYGKKSQTHQVCTSVRLRSMEKARPPPQPVLESDDSDEGVDT
jgi:hypothetical protein